MLKQPFWIFCLFMVVPPSLWAKDPGRVLLRDVQVLTLHEGRMTTGRRSSPVPQLSCVGGSATGDFRPLVVQCYNRGWDGMDVQWECKADMDNLYRFGSVEVVCEGYDYPEDAYITAGSCGLEYTLEYTQEGRQKKGYAKSQDKGWNFFGSKSDPIDQGTFSGRPLVGKWKGLSDLTFFIVTAAIMYGIYKFCLAQNGNIGDRQYSSTNDDYPAGGGGGGGWFNPGAGDDADIRRRQNYSNPNYDDASCGAGAGSRQRGTGAGATGGGGFWSGLATGGLLGYMFGNRGGGAPQYGYDGYRGYSNRGWNRGSDNSFGTASPSFSSMSSGTRVASGFGGTRRR